MREEGNLYVDYNRVFFSRRYKGFIFTLLAFLFSGSFFAGNATNIVSVASGSWGATTTWSPAQVPVAGDVVTIANTHTVTIDGTGVNGTTPACATLTVGQGSSGILQFTSTSGGSACTLTVSGNLTIAASASLKIASGGIGAFAHSLKVGGNIAFGNGGSILNFSSVGATTVATTITGTSNISVGAGGSGGFCTFNDLQVNPTSTTTISRTISINGNLQIGDGISSGAIFQFNNSSAVSTSVLGNVTIPAAGGTFRSAASTGSAVTHFFTVSGNISISGSSPSSTFNLTTFTGQTSVNVNTTITGSSSSISGNGTATFNELLVNNGSGFTLGIAFISCKKLTVGSGTSGVLQYISSGTQACSLSIGSIGLIVSAGGIFKISSVGSASIAHTLTVSGNITVSGSSAATGLDLTSVGATSVNTNINGTTASVTFTSTNTASCIFNNLTIGNTTTTLARNAIVKGDLIINNGSTLDLSTFTLNGLSGKTISLAGTAVLKLASNTGGQAGSNFPSGFTFFSDGVSSTTSFSSGSTVEYSGNALFTPQTIYSGPIYGNLTLSSSSGTTTKTAGGALTIASDLFIGANTIFDAAALSHALGGSWTNNGVFTSTGSTITFNGPGTGKTIGGSVVTSFNNFVLNKTDNTKTVTLAMNMNVNGTSTFTSGKFILNGGAIALNQSSAAISIASNAIIQVASPAVLTVPNADVSVSGGFQLVSGDVNFGTSGSNVLTLSGSAVSFAMQGGALNVAGRFHNSATGASSVSVTGGTITLCTGLLNDASRAVFEMDASAVFNQSSGGTIILQNKNQGSAGDVVISNGVGSKTFNAGIVQFGNASTSSGTVFSCNSEIPFWGVKLGTSSARANVNLLNDLRVQNDLTLFRGVITTNSFNVIVPSGTNLSAGRTPTSSQESYINGNLIYRFTLSGSGSNTFSSRFEVGDTYYAPVDPNLSYNYNFGSSTNVDLRASVKSGIDPNDPAPLYPSGLSPVSRANHYWGLGYSNSTGGTFSSFTSNPVFNFTGLGSDATGNTANYIIAKYDPFTWTIPSVGTRTGTGTQATGITNFSSFEAGEPCSVPSLSLVSSHVNCNGGNNGAVTLSVTGGTSPFTYSWSNGATTQDINNLTQGTYSVTVVGSGGCAAIASAHVTQPAILTANCGGANLTCIGSCDGRASVTAIGGTAPYSYLWSTSQTNYLISGLAAGSYSVTVTDSCGASAVCFFQVSNPPVLSSSCNGSHVSCKGNSDGILSATASGGTLPYSYLWSNGATTFVRSGLTAGLYSVTVTDNCGVTSSTTFAVTEPSALTVSCAGTNGCYGGNNGTAYASPSGGTSPYSYLWSNGSTNVSVFNLSVGTYSVTVTDLHGCSGASFYVVVEPPPLAVTVGSNGFVCAGSTINLSSVVTGGTISYQYAWTGPAGFSSTAANPSVISGTTSYSGTYSLVVTDANGCTDFSSTNVIVDPCTAAIINLKLFISGYYMGGSQMQPVLTNQGVSGATGAEADTVYVELRRNNPPNYDLGEIDTAVLMTDGTASASFKGSAIGNSYWIAVRHRNAVQIWSSSALQINLVNSYDFTISQSNAYGSNMSQPEPGVFALYNGDINQDENIDLLDFPILDLGINTGLFGYYTGDLNGDGNIDLLDFPILDYGINIGIFSMHP